MASIARRRAEKSDRRGRCRRAIQAPPGGRGKFRTLSDTRYANICAIPALGAAELPQFSACFAHGTKRFCKPSPALRTHHLHLVPFSSPLWLERLAFRDRLRSDRDLASEYSELKRALAAKFKLDREAYTDAKTPFVAACAGSIPARRA